ncbi:HAD domain-containing protein [Marinoscillum sp.]|uniref:HAD domain-containing protein n=1 Tax=Marinoscillum sp. TaxID=2024838 RepID=UPI003BAB7246
MTVLLDIDGVLVTTPGWRISEQHKDGFLKFNDRAEKNLARLISETNATIVLTTTHRITYSVEKWKEIFNNRGIPVETIEKVNTKQTVGDMLNRGNEIKEWIDNFGADRRFVIIDDDLSINALPLEIKDKCVMTKSMIGLDEEATDRAIKILRGS